MPNCPKCQTQNPEGNQFCIKCGAQLNATSQTSQTTNLTSTTPPASSPETLLPPSPPPTSQPTPLKKPWHKVWWKAVLVLLFAGPLGMVIIYIISEKSKLPDKTKKILSIIIGLIFFILSVFLFGMPEKKKTETSSIFSKSQASPTQTPISTTSKKEQVSDDCLQIYQDILDKYGGNYEECLSEVSVDVTDCQKPSGFTDEFKENLNVLIILDSSGSMAQSVSGGQKMQIAKEAISDFVNSLPERTKVGLMVYGHKGSNNTSDKILSCAGIEMIYPLSEINITSFNAAVASFNPTGWTPIADSFQKAKEIFGAYGVETNSNLIYLVSDGIETCGGDPVTAARQLRESNTKAMVNIIGFDVNDEAQRQLKEAAEVGGGTYYQANNADEIKKVFGDQLKSLTEYNKYWLCNVTQSNKIWLAITTNQNRIWLCITTKHNMEWLNITNTTNRWGLDDPKDKCISYITEQQNLKKDNLDKWKKDILDKLQERKDITLDKLKSELEKVTQEYNGKE